MCSCRIEQIPQNQVNILEYQQNRNKTFNNRNKTSNNINKTYIRTFRIEQIPQTLVNPWKL